MNGVNIESTPIIIDKWSPSHHQGKSVFILTHAHGDHTKGLTAAWKKPIYCTKLTALLVQKLIGVQPEFFITVEERWAQIYIRQSVGFTGVGRYRRKMLIQLNRDTYLLTTAVKKMGESQIIPLDSSGRVTCSLKFIDANHCPGAVMVLLQGYFGCVLATGDFRYTPSQIQAIGLPAGCIDTVYLDTSYNNPKYSSFPTIESVCHQAVSIVKKHPNKEIVLGDYNVGKEQLLLHIALECKERIHVQPKRYSLLQLQELPDVFTMDESASRIHAVSMSQVVSSARRLLRDGCDVFIIIPSGRSNVIAASVYRAGISPSSVHKLFYSEHSSYEELLTFIERLKPKCVRPTVTSPPEPGVSVDNMAHYTRLLSTSPPLRYKLPEEVRNPGVPLSSATAAGATDLVSKNQRRKKVKRNRGVVFTTPTKSDKTTSRDDEVYSMPSSTAETMNRDQASTDTCAKPATSMASPTRCRISMQDYVRAQRFAEYLSEADNPQKLWGILSDQDWENKKPGVLISRIRPRKSTPEHQICYSDILEAYRTFNEVSVYPPVRQNVTLDSVRTQAPGGAAVYHNLELVRKLQRQKYASTIVALVRLVDVVRYGEAASDTTIINADTEHVATISDTSEVEGEQFKNNESFDAAGRSSSIRDPTNTHHKVSKSVVARKRKLFNPTQDSLFSQTPPPTLYFSVDSNESDGSIHLGRKRRAA